MNNIIKGLKKVDWVNVGLGIAGVTTFVLGIVQNKQDQKSTDEAMRKVAEEVFNNRK